MNSAETWQYIHTERAQMADTLAGLSDSQWALPSWCRGWSVGDTAGHILAAAEQTPVNFFREMLQARFRFDVFAGRDAKRLGALDRGNWSGGYVLGPRPRTIRRLRSSPCWGRSSCTARTSAGRWTSIIDRPNPLSSPWPTTIRRPTCSSAPNEESPGCASEPRTAAGRAGKDPRFPDRYLIVLAMSGRHGACNDLDGEGVRDPRGAMLALSRAERPVEPGSRGAGGYRGRASVRRVVTRKASDRPLRMDQPSSEPSAGTSSTSRTRQRLEDWVSEIRTPITLALARPDGNRSGSSGT